MPQAHGHFFGRFCSTGTWSRKQLEPQDRKITGELQAHTAAAYQATPAMNK